MTFVRYSNLCAGVTRNTLKEPLRTTAKTQRDSVSITLMPWVNGKAPAPATYVTGEKIKLQVSMDADS